MPLYDCMLLLKPHLKKEVVIELVARVGKHVYSRNGVLTDITSFGEVQLGYGIKKLDGRYYKGRLMQMTMMATPHINKELQYLNKEDRLLRWLLVKHRGMKNGKENRWDLYSEADVKEYGSSSLMDLQDIEKEDEDDDEYDSEDVETNSEDVGRKEH